LHIWDVAARDGRGLSIGQVDRARDGKTNAQN